MMQIRDKDVRFIFAMSKNSTTLNFNKLSIFDFILTHKKGRGFHSCRVYADDCQVLFSRPISAEIASRNQVRG